MKNILQTLFLCSALVFTTIVKTSANSTILLATNTQAVALTSIQKSASSELSGDVSKDQKLTKKQTRKLRRAMVLSSMESGDGTVAGIVSTAWVFLFWIPVVGLGGLIFGLVGLKRSRRSDNKLGLIFSIIGLLIGIWALIWTLIVLLAVGGAASTV
ncbi:MAG: hypothetical protein ACRCVT_00850 [Leadbetterella sp.]